MIINTIENQIWQLLESVSDPEIPVLSVVDLGIIRTVSIQEDLVGLNEKKVLVTITPTYTGCPAMDMISGQIRMVLSEEGFKHVQIIQTLSPAWTTDWMSESGKQKLKAYGIAAPIGKSFDQIYLNDLNVACPQCGSEKTKLVSEFGSTACKALFRCEDCMEPFDYFKCH